MSSVFDEAEATVERASRIADAVAIVRVLEIGGAFYRQASGIPAPRPASGWDAYRPIVVEVLHGAFGVIDGAQMRLYLPGGQIGCDGYSVDLTQVIDKPSAYAVFVLNDRDLVGNRVAEPTIVRAWPITNDGKVDTPYDGELTVAEFITAAASSR